MAADQEAVPLTQAERSALSDQAMLEAAIDLVIEHGTDKTTLAMIGERAGYSRGLATYRFGSKAGLFDALCKNVARRWLDYLTQRVDGQTGLEALCSTLDAIRDFLAEKPREGRVLQILHAASASPGSEFPETSASIHRSQRDDVSEWVRQGQKNGEIRSDLDPDAVAADYVARTTGMTYLWLISPDGFDISSSTHEMKRQLVSALAAA